VKSNKPPFEKQLLTAAGRPGKCQCLWQWAPGPAVHAGPGAAHGAWIGHGGAPCGAVCAAPMGRAASLGQGADPPMGIGDGGASPSPPNRGRGRERVPDSGQIGDGDGDGPRLSACAEQPHLNYSRQLSKLMRVTVMTS